MPVLIEPPSEIVGVLIAGENMRAVAMLQPTVDARVIAVFGNTIATPSGSLVDVFSLGNCCMLKDFVQSTSRWLVTGVTRDSAGAALGTCRVVALEVGRIQIDGAPVVAETISDGSGNFSLTVPMNVAYQLLAYKAGAPDLGGVSVVTSTPAQV